MRYLSSKPMIVMIVMLFGIGAVSLMGLLGQLMWQPTLSPAEVTHVGAWRELRLQDRTFEQGLLVNRVAKGNMLVGTFRNNKPESAIVMIDLLSGDVQQISEFGPRYYTAPNEYQLSRISPGPFVDLYVVWIENSPPEDTESPDKTEELHIYDDRVEELHIYDLENKSQKTVIVPGTLYPTDTDYSANTIVWDGVIDGVRGIYRYDIQEDEFSIVEGSAYGHVLMRPDACDDTWISYLVMDSRENYLTTLYAQNLKTDEKIRLGDVQLSQNMGYDITRHTCDRQHVVWVATDPSSQEEHLQIYDLKQHQQRKVQIVGQSKIPSIHLDNQIVSTRIDVFNSIGYDLENDTFFNVKRSASMRSSRETSPSEFMTADHWIHIQMMSDERQKIMVASITRGN